MKTSDLKRLIWYIPVILTLHNLEEALTMPHWILLHLPLLREKIWLFDEFQFSTKQLYLSLISVTFFPFLISFFCQRGELSKRKLEIMMVLQSVIFWNALMPHISGLFVLGMYNPGTVTAVVCNIPFTFYLFSRVKNEGLVSNAMLRNIFTLGFAVYLPLVYANHLIAQSLAKIM